MFACVYIIIFALDLGGATIYQDSGGAADAKGVTEGNSQAASSEKPSITLYLYAH
jgi:hypothetical protein